jgi:hypothetical protein
MEALLTAIDRALHSDPVIEAELRVPQQEGAALAAIEAGMVVHSAGSTKATWFGSPSADRPRWWGGCAVPVCGKSFELDAFPRGLKPNDSLLAPIGAAKAAPFQSNNDDTIQSNAAPFQSNDSNLVQSNNNGTIVALRGKEKP